MVIVENLRKHYGKFVALDGMKFQINEGELYGFVGPNGAGKTTTMRIMAGLLRADEGVVEIDGVDALREPKKIKQMIGYMPDFFGVYDNLKVSEYMDFFSSVYGITGKKAKKVYEKQLDLVNLSDKTDCYVDVLSRGQKQRLCLARCLLCDPKLLILDEPASGLDPRARFEMKEVLCNLSQSGKTILISSHILPELAQMCTNIGIVESGKMVLSGTVDEIMSQFNSSNPIVMKVIEGQEKIIAFLKEEKQIESISTNGNRVYAGFKGNRLDEAKLLQRILGQGVLISSFGRAEGNLESLFMEITDKKE